LLFNLLPAVVVLIHIFSKNFFLGFLIYSYKTVNLYSLFMLLDFSWTWSELFLIVICMTPAAFGLCDVEIKWHVN